MLHGLLRRCCSVSRCHTLAGRYLSTTSYIVAGEGIATPNSPVLILHGALGNCTNWRTLSRRISSGVNAPVYALDAPNHGDGPWTDTMSYHSMADGVAEFVQEKSLGKVRLIGHSMGGKIVMVVALKYPKLVEKLVVVDSSPAHSDGIEAIDGYIKAMRALDLSKIQARSQVGPALKPFVPEQGIREFISMNASVDETTKKLRWRCNLEAIERFLPELGEFPKFSRLEAASSVRTLFIGGLDSKHIVAKHHAAIYKLFPKAQITKIPGGHWVHYDNPADFLQYATSFLKS